MKRLAEELYLLDGFPPNAINVYVIGDVLVDAGSRFAARRILRQLERRPITGIPGLHEPKSFFTPDPRRNRESMRRLAALEPALVCFGHGAPLRDPNKLGTLVDSLTDG